MEQFINRLILKLLRADICLSNKYITISNNTASSSYTLINGAEIT